jgi:hypothetical protein
MVIQARPAAGLARGITCALGLGIGAVWWLVDADLQVPVQLTLVDLVLFATAAAVMELLPIAQPFGRAIPASLAVIGAAAMLGAAPPVVALIAAIAWVLARLVDRGPAEAGPLLLRAVGCWTLAGVAAMGVAIGPATWYGSAPNGAVAAAVNPGAALAVVFTIVVGVPALDTIVRARHSWRFVFRRVGEAILGNGLVGIAVASTAVLGTLVHPVLGRWTLPTMLIPLFAARIGLDRYAVAARAYDQTIRAMSRLPEQLPAVTQGHGVRVADLAAEVALEMGLDASTVADVVRAAHLHELGRIKLERDAPVGQRELARAGASVIHEASSLERVARVVEAHGDLRSEVAQDPRVGVSARIVAACCEIDRYAPAAEDQRHEVVVRLVREVGDLDVVRALTRALDRRELPA